MGFVSSPPPTLILHLPFFKAVIAHMMAYQVTWKNNLISRDLKQPSTSFQLTNLPLLREVIGRPQLFPSDLYRLPFLRTEPICPL